MLSASRTFFIRPMMKRISPSSTLAIEKSGLLICGTMSCIRSIGPMEIVGNIMIDAAKERSPHRGFIFPERASAIHAIALNVKNERPSGSGRPGTAKSVLKSALTVSTRNPQYLKYPRIRRLTMTAPTKIHCRERSPRSVSARSYPTQ